MSETSETPSFGPELEQPRFYKDIDEFEPGDRIWVSGSDLISPFEGDRQIATVLQTIKTGNFTRQASVLVDGASDIVTTNKVDHLTKFELASLEGQDRVVVQAGYLKPGHVMDAIGIRETVQAIEHSGSNLVLTLFDPVTQETRQMKCGETSEYYVRIAEPSEEKRQWRARRAASHMLPPIEIRTGEKPDELAKRIMRFLEEWTE